MTTTATKADPAASVSLCTDNADFSYVPYEIWTKQRVIRGDGKVATLGRFMWEGLINSFPDLSNEVHSITASEDGKVAAVVSIGGNQAKPWGPIASQGKKYWEPHAFIFDVNDDGQIESLTANAGRINTSRSDQTSWSLGGATEEEVTS